MRKEFSRKTRRLAWERCNELCEGLVVRDGMMQRCGAPLAHGRFEYDHDIPDWISSDNSLDNCVVLCKPCHDEKTARDQGDIAKVKRIRDKRSKALTSKRPMPHGKKSLTKRTFSGRVVPR